MAHSLHWIVERRVMLTTFHGSVSADELKGFIAEVREQAAEGIPLVHHISNSLDLQRVEFSLATARNLTSALDMMREITWQVDINRNPMNRMFANIISQFANVRTRTFPTPQEAVDFLKKIDPTLTEADWKLHLLADDDYKPTSATDNEESVS